MEKMVVKRFAPFTPLAKPLGPQDPIPIFEWKAVEAEPDREFKLEISKDAGCRSWPEPDLLKNDPIRERRDKLYENILHFEKEYWKYERSDHTMCNEQTLLDMARIVENATTIRIDINGEEMQLTPHRLALYGRYKVKKMFVNIQAELEMELEEC